MASKKIVKVLDRTDAVLIEFKAGIPSETTVDEFKKILVKECDKISNSLF
jgi:small-conductance mechanosensitive channel